MSYEKSASKDRSESVAEMQVRIKALEADKRRIEQEMRELEQAIKAKMEADQNAEAPEFSEPVTIPLEWLEPENDKEHLLQLEGVMAKYEKKRSKSYPEGFREILSNHFEPRHAQWMDPSQRLEDYKLIVNGDMDEMTSAGVTARDLMKQKYPGWEIQDFKDMVDFMETENPAELLDPEPTKDSGIIAKKFAEEFDANFEENAWDPEATLHSVIIDLLAAQDKYKEIDILDEDALRAKFYEYTKSDEEFIDGETVTNIYFMDEHVARTKYDSAEGYKQTTCNEAALQKALVKFFDEFEMPEDPYKIGRNPF